MKAAENEDHLKLKSKNGNRANRTNRKRNKTEQQKKNETGKRPTETTTHLAGTGKNAVDGNNTAAENHHQTNVDDRNKRWYGEQRLSS
ncbi:hypothetical protein A2U01_0075813, partial [Trifolium medium]|nr:hypothetical protein [Trifolium medium]